MNCKTCGGPLRITRPGDEGICPHCTMAGLFDDPEIQSGSEEVDDYEIKREIGRGGDGTVYLGFDSKVGREVAIKLINSDRRIDKTTERRFRAESEAIACLDHPHIIPIYANGKMDGRPFYTMKFVTGGSLATRLDEFATPDAAAALMIKVARAVHHAHERGILHRDLKPSNILLDDQLEPFISDFGLAKRYEDNNDLTLTGAVMGTPSFMSPEQARGDNAQITTTSDVFSLGSILYQILTGKLPFEGSTSHHVLRSVIETQVTFPKGTRHNINKDLETICLKCLEKDSSKRYSTALALAEDLERWQNHLPVRARRITATERATRWVRRHPLPAGALALATLSLITGSIVSLVLWQKAEHARAETIKEKINVEEARDAAEDHSYLSDIANAMSARQDFDYGETRRVLFDTPPDRRGTEWRLIDGLSRGDQDWTTRLGDTLPVSLAHDIARNRFVLLTEDRHYHEINLTTGELTHLGTLPDTLAHSLEGLQKPGLRNFEFAPDGKHYSFIDNNQLLIVNLERNQLIFQEKANRASTSAWLDSNRIMQVARPGDTYHKNSSGNYKKTSWIYHLDNQQLEDPPPSGWTGPIASSPDKKLLAVGRIGSWVDARNTADPLTGTPIFSTKMKRGPVEDARLSSNGDYLAVSWAGMKKITEVFKPRTGETLFTSTSSGHPKYAFLQEPDELVHNGSNPWFFSRNLSAPEDLTPVTPPSQMMSRVSGDKATSFYFGHTAPIVIMLSISKNEVLTASRDQTLRKWTRPAPDRPVGNTSLETYHPTASQSGEYCAYRKSDFISCVEHLPSGFISDIPGDQVYLAVFNDGRLLSRIRKDGTIICWQSSTNGPLKKLWQLNPGPCNPYNAHAIHSLTSLNERFVAFLQPGHLITVDMELQKAWTTTDQTMSFGSSPGQTVAISDDGKYAAVTAFRGPNARLYRSNDLTQYETLIPETERTSRDSACAFSRDGSRIFVGNNDGWIRVFDTATKMEIPSESWMAHSSEVTALAISQRGDIIASAGGDTAYFWSSETRSDEERRLLLRLKPGSSPRNWIQFGKDDTRFLHSGVQSPIEIWPAPRAPAQTNPPSRIRPLPKPVPALQK